MKVDSYDFGEIVIDGRAYRSDVIVLPGSVRSGWWRKEGHRLDIGDLREVIEARPDVLVVGTGYHGRLVVAGDLVEALRGMGIELLAFDTARAVESFNDLSAGGNVAAAFHLTC